MMLSDSDGGAAASVSAQQPSKQQQQQQLPGAATIVSSNSSMGNCNLPDHPVDMICHHCKASINTKAVREIGLTNWMAAGAVAILGSGLLCIYTGCCLVPFCIGALKDVNHYCPECSKVLGQHKILA